MDRSNIFLINHQKSDQRKTSNVVCFSEVKIVTWKHHQEIYSGTLLNILENLNILAYYFEWFTPSTAMAREFNLTLFI